MEYRFDDSLSECEMSLDISVNDLQPYSFEPLAHAGHSRHENQETSSISLASIV